MGKASNLTIGYKYYMGLHMGIGRGEMDELCEIKVGDRQAWQGSVTGNARIRIDKPKLFGGTKAEGGIDGYLDVMMGGPTQIKSAGLAAMLTGRQPEFRGIVSTFFDGMVCAMNPYPKKWAFRMRRIFSGWDGGTWYPEKAQILLNGYYDDGTTREIKAMNGVHIIYECLTNRAWGLGRDRSLFLDDSWRKAADTLYDEGMGLCLRWGRQDTLMAFVQTVIDHIGGAVYVDKFTGKFKIKLTRNDYDPDALPVFDTDSGLLEITEATNASPFNFVNEVVIIGHNPVTDKDIQMRQHNLALIQTQGSVNSQTTEYPGFPTPELCLVAAERELRSMSTNARRFSLTLDRRAWHLQPCDVIKVRDPQSRGIETVILRIGTTEESGQVDGSIKVVAVQDVFAVDLNTFSDVQPPGHAEPDFTPKLARRIIYEAAYAELVRLIPDGEFAAIKPTEGYLHAHAERPSSTSMAFDIAVRRPGEADFAVNGNGDFTPLAELAGTIDYLDTVLTYQKEVDLDDEDEVFPGMVMLIGTQEAHEFVKLVSIDRVMKTMTITRGCFDTIPQRHFGLELIWAVQDNGGSDFTKYITGTEIEVKILPWTMRGGSFAIEDAPIDHLRFAHRFYRPYAPGQTTWETLALGVKHWYELQDFRYDVTTNEVPDFATFRWAHRDRPLQADQIIDHTLGNIGPEPGTTYKLSFYNAIGELVRTETGITGTQYVYTYAQAAQDTKVEEASTEFTSGSVYLEAVRDGVVSWMGYRFQFTIHKKPPQVARVAALAMQTTADDPQFGTGEDAVENAEVAMLSEQTAQNYDDSEDPDDSVVGSSQVAMLAAPVSQDTKLIPIIDFYLYEAPYLSLVREGRNTSSSQLKAFVARPSDRLTDGFDLFNREESETSWSNDGAQPWTPWGILKGFMSFLTDEFELTDTSDTDGVPIAAVRAGDIMLMDNELVVIESVNGKRFKVGRGVADTVPDVHYAGSIVWMFDRANAASNRLFGDTATVYAVTRPHTYAGTISPEDMPSKKLAMQTRPRRPYPPGLVLANGLHWYEQVKAYPDDMDLLAPVGKDVILTWAHRNRIWQDDTAYDHFASGISPEAGVRYRVWVGYSYFNGTQGAEATLAVYYVTGNGITLKKDDLERWGRTAGLANKQGGVSVLRVAINAERDNLFNWQGYGLTVIAPSYPLPPGEQPGGGGIPNPNYPNPGDNTPNPNNPGGGGNPGDGGSVDPTPDPNNPNPNPDPDVPGTNPPGPNPDPKPDPNNVFGWSNNWDHGWAGDLPNQSGDD